MMQQQMPMPMPVSAPMPQHPGYSHQQESESSRYRQEIMNIFTSEKFMTSVESMKKQMVGTHIFKYVTNLVTSEFSPKITGMIIDLPIADLNYSVSTLETLQVKVKSAVELLVDTGNLQDHQVRQLPVF